VNKVRGKDDSDNPNGDADQKCVLAGDKGKEKDAAFSDMDKTPITNDTSIAKKECGPGG